MLFMMWVRDAVLFHADLQSLVEGIMVSTWINILSLFSPFQTILMQLQI